MIDYQVKRRHHSAGPNRAPRQFYTLVPRLDRQICDLNGHSLENQVPANLKRTVEQIVTRKILFACLNLQLIDHFANNLRLSSLSDS